MDVAVNGLWLSTIGASLYERRLPVLPTSEDHTVKLAGADGVLDFGATYAARDIGLTFEIAAGPSEYHATMANLARVFNARRGELTLEFADMPGKYYRATYAGTLALSGSTGSRLADVPLRMNDPWPVGPEQITEVRITGDPQTITVPSNSDMSAYPVITIQNVGTNTVHGLTLSNEFLVEE